MGPAAGPDLGAPEPEEDADGDGLTGALPAGLTRDDLIAEVAHACRPLPRGEAVLLAVSGGPDSTAMAHLLSLARGDLALTVGHVRHGLREDAVDAAVAAEHAKALELPYVEDSIEVRLDGRGVEAAARDARYAALERQAQAASARWVAIAHTADDQAETVLLNLVRGSGLQGLAGMRPVRQHGSIRILRPLLRIRRVDIAAFVEGEGLAAVADPTNRDADQRRARARHDILPVLKRLAGGPGDPVGTLARFATLARADADALEALARELFAEVVVVWGPTRALRRPDLLQMPAALATRIVRQTAAAVGARGLPARAVEQILELRPGEAVHVTGNAFVSYGGGWLGFAPSGLRALEARTLTIPGTTALPELGLDLHVEWPWPAPPATDPGQLDLGPPDRPKLEDVIDERPPGPCAAPPPGTGPRARMWAVFPASVGAGFEPGSGLRIRSRHDGDRVRVPAGVRKLQDLLVDAHVPRACRDLVPVIVDRQDDTLWVPGVAQRAFDRTQPAGVRMWLAPGAEVATGVRAGHDLWV